MKQLEAALILNDMKENIQDSNVSDIFIINRVVCKISQIS